MLSISSVYELDAFIFEVSLDGVAGGDGVETQNREWSLDPSLGFEVQGGDAHVQISVAIVIRKKCKVLLLKQPQE